MFGNYGYAPYQYGTPQYAPVQPQQLPQTYQQPQTSGITWVESDAGAESLRVEPGHSALAMNANTMRLYMKTVDQAGIPTTRRYNLVEVVDEPSGNSGKFVTMDEFKKTQEQLLTLTNEVLAMKKGGAGNG